MRRALFLASLLCALGGCAPVPAPTFALLGPYGAPPLVLPNPLPVANLDRDFVWEQVVDVVDDYFKIEREERPRLAGDLLTEGRLDTYPQTGATLLEPWRGDSVTAADRLESTLQSMRRRAFVRVIPTQTGFSIDVAVLKELENVERPDHATVGGTLYRTDLSQDRLAENAGERPDPIPAKAKPVGSHPKIVPTPLSWIPKGRDAILEQQILNKLQLRFAAAAGADIGPILQPGIPAVPELLPPVQ